MFGLNVHDSSLSKVEAALTLPGFDFARSRRLEASLYNLSVTVPVHISFKFLTCAIFSERLFICGRKLSC